MMSTHRPNIQRDSLGRTTSFDSNDRTILYSYRDISALLCQKSQKFSHPPHKLPRRSPSLFNRPLPNLVNIQANNHWWTLLFSIFYFPSTLRVTAHNMLQLDARLGKIWGFSTLIFVRGHFYEISIAALLFRVKPRHVEKFRKFRCADVEKSVLGKKEKETCAKHKIDRSQNGRSNKLIHNLWLCCSAWPVATRDISQVNV